MVKLLKTDLIVTLFRVRFRYVSSMGRGFHRGVRLLALLIIWACLWCHPAAWNNVSVWRKLVTFAATCFLNKSCSVQSSASESYLCLFVTWESKCSLGFVWYRHCTSKKVLSERQALDIFCSFFHKLRKTNIQNLWQFPVVCHSKAALCTILHLVPAITLCNTLFFVGKSDISSKWLLWDRLRKNKMSEMVACC